MLKYNRYLKELGITKKDFPFVLKKPKADKDGFKESEFYSLDYTLSLYIYSQLCYFRDNCMYGYPAKFSSIEKWEAVIDKMIEAFKLMILESKNDDIDYVLSSSKAKKIRQGLRLFIKYYHDLWY